MFKLPSNNNYKKQVLALRGIFQAAGLVHTIAKGEFENQADFETSLESLFIRAPKTAIDCYPGQHFTTGTKYLKQFFGRDYNPNIIQVCRYAFSLFKIYRIFKKSPSLRNKLDKLISEVESKRTFFQEPLAPAIIEQLAAGYVDIFGGLSFRIQIIGKKIVLNDPNRLAKMRCLLLAGLRSVYLWEQLGGNLFKLFFFRKRYFKEFELTLLKPVEAQG